MSIIKYQKPDTLHILGQLKTVYCHTMVINIQNKLCPFILYVLIVIHILNISWKCIRLQKLLIVEFTNYHSEKQILWIYVERLLTNILSIKFCFKLLQQTNSEHASSYVNSVNSVKISFVKQTFFNSLDITNKFDTRMSFCIFKENFCDSFGSSCTL